MHQARLSALSAAQQHGGRIYGLDMMRAYAIFTVVYAHGYDWLQGHVSHALYILPLSDGVTIFFVLSGFLIGNILLRLGDQGRTAMGDLVLFLQRRWLRTVPNYLLVLALLMVCAVAWGNPLPEAPWRYALFLQNFSAPHPGFFPESWSLPVEEWFYLLFPICLFALWGVAKPARATALCLALFILGPALLRLWRIEALNITEVAVWTAQVKMQVLTRLDSIAYGVLMAVVLKRHAMTQRLRRNLFAVGVALFIFDKVQLYAVGGTFYVLHITLLAETFAAMLLLPYLCTIRSGAGAVFRAVTGLSKVSYALYLVHLSFVGLLVIPAVSQALGLGDGAAATALRYTLYWALSLGVAAALYHFYEQPILRLRERLRPDGIRPDGMKPHNATPAYLGHKQYARLPAMRTSVILVGFAVAAVIAARPAAAACICVCVDGKPKAQCPSVLETAACPASICQADRPRSAPPITRKEDCQIVQGVNPATNRVERRLVCK